jgi:16S rRNA (adenine1518-N6/adenine1519-N6)-dimethyltransferase
MSLSPSETTSLLNKLGHHPKKKLGQNFLIDGNIVDKSIRLAELAPGGEVVEIGPGLGTLTRRLLESGQSVYAVEIDRALAQNLNDTESKSIESGKLAIIRGDAVKNPLGLLPSSAEKYLIVANLPYAISSAWLESMLNTQKLPTRMVLMMQKEAVQRIWAQPGTKEYHALSIFISNAFFLTSKHPVSRKCFFPAPAVDSMLIRMDLRESAYLFSEVSRRLIRRIFTQRRKQLGSLIKKEEPLVRQAMEEWLDELKLSPLLRSEQVSATDWKRLGVMLDR